MKKLINVCIVLCSLLVRAQDDSIPPHFEIVGDYYDNNYSVFYPLGWSKTGKLAYIVQDVNSLGGAEIYTYDLIVTSDQGWGNCFEESTTYNLEIDTSYWAFHQEYYDYHDTTHFNYSFFKEVYWSSHKQHIDKVLKHHKVHRDSSKFVHSIHELERNGISLIIEKETDTIDAIRVDKKIIIETNFKGTSERIFSKTNRIDENGWVVDMWGNATDLLYYQIPGYIKSPYSNHCYLYIHEVSMGFEEPAEKVILTSFNWLVK